MKDGEGFASGTADTIVVPGRPVPVELITVHAIIRSLINNGRAIQR